jgi:hypothetical protein
MHRIIDNFDIARMQPVKMRSYGLNTSSLYLQCLRISEPNSLEISRAQNTFLLATLFLSSKIIL